MRIGISNIGWKPEDVESNTQLALDLGFDYIESAYAKTSLSKSIYAVQGIFYQSGVESFSDPGSYDHLCRVVDYCLENKVKIITFGSPSMRTGNKKDMLDLLIKIDQYINKEDCIVCVEPNARKYGGEYYYTLDEIVGDIKELKNIKTMIDTGNLYLEQLDPVEQFKKHKEYIAHVHISTPDLDSISVATPYDNVVVDIKALGYDQCITYECMKFLNLKEEIQYFLNNVYRSSP